MSDTTVLLPSPTPPTPPLPETPAASAPADAAPAQAAPGRGRRAPLEMPAFGLPHVSSSEIRAVRMSSPIEM